ncbi:MAG TPA: hypothetical protein VMY18_12550 [Acidobacteriota bacterium]|nr:hypothetical protein [Acidobacteriota bacterium]
MGNREREERASGMWRRIYLAVIANTLLVFVALWWFSKAFR